MSGRGAQSKKYVPKKMSLFFWAAKLGRKMMARINRKQVPLCRPCHLKVHRGNYLGMSLQHFKYIK